MYRTSSCGVSGTARRGTVAWLHSCSGKRLHEPCLYNLAFPRSHCSCCGTRSPSRCLHWSASSRSPSS